MSVPKNPSGASGAGYAGDLAPREAWELLEQDGPSVLIDVRTMPEWQFVGIPDLSVLGKEALLIEWQSFPTMGTNAQFLSRLEELLAQLGVSSETPLLFLCRSGGRSRAAAIAATAAGHSRCFNISSGFEGNHDAERHRGRVGGWKADGLPWVQS